MNARHSSATNEHYTPGPIVRAARETLGAIDIDPASCARANTVVRAKRFFDERDNGFRKSWVGRVFLNPPGGMCDQDGVSLSKRIGRKGWFRPDGTKAKPHSAQRAWWFRLAYEREVGRTTSAIFVCFSVELLQTTQTDPPPGGALPLDFPICFPAQRVDYLRGEPLRPGGAPPHASAIVFLPPKYGVDVREDIRRFRDAFEPLGRCVNVR